MDSIGLIHLKYFLFFIFGTIIRKYFSKFEYALTNTSLLLVSICIFFGFNILSDIVLGINIMGFYLATSLTGIIIVFALFKKNNDTFSHNHTVGRIMQFIGRRTLDIYLLHYFFIMTNMDNVLPNFSTLNSPFLEFICSLIISIFVILACLAVSHILRLSPALGYFLFGQKRKAN